MLPSRGLLRSSSTLRLARVALPLPPSPVLSRRFGTALRDNGLALHGASTSKRIAASQRAVFPLRQARNASTQSTIPPADPVADASSLADVAGTPLNLTGSDLLDIPEQIGFLKTLGLEYGWGPTALMQTILESVYVYTGLPWWASIAVVAFGVKAALFKVSLDAQENQRKQQELSKNPRYQAAVDEMKRTMITGNHLAGAEARAKISYMHQAAGYKLWKSFVPMVQLPIGFAMFRLIRGMAALPVPSFETGGVLWFTDLTVPDPFFILPIFSSLMMAVSMRESIPYAPPQQQRMMKLMSLVLVPVSAAVALFLPSGLSLYFFVSSFLHFLQAYLSHQPWLRRWLGLSPLERRATSGSQPSWQAPRIVDVHAPRVTPAQPATAPARETAFQSLKSTFAAAKDMMEERTDKSVHTSHEKAAREYDEKRALEEKEKLVARLEQRRSKNGHY